MEFPDQPPAAPASAAGVDRAIFRLTPQAARKFLRGLVRIAVLEAVLLVVKLVQPQPLPPLVDALLWTSIVFLSAVLLMLAAAVWTGRIVVYDDRITLSCVLGQRVVRFDQIRHSSVVGSRDRRLVLHGDGGRTLAEIPLSGFSEQDQRRLSELFLP